MREMVMAKAPILGWAESGGHSAILVHSTELSRSVSSPSLWICCG